MNATVNNAVASTKNFVHKHKVALAVTATAALGLALNKRNMNMCDEFLKEHGLYETYWAIEEV